MIVNINGTGDKPASVTEINNKDVITIDITPFTSAERKRLITGLKNAQIYEADERTYLKVGKERGRK